MPIPKEQTEGELVENLELPTIKQKEMETVFLAEIKDFKKQKKSLDITCIVGISPNADYCNFGKLEAILSKANESFSKIFILVCDIPYIYGDIKIRYPDLSEAKRKEIAIKNRDEWGERNKDILKKYIGKIEIIFTESMMNEDGVNSYNEMFEKYRDEFDKGKKVFKKSLTDSQIHGVDENEIVDVDKNSDCFPKSASPAEIRSYKYFVGITKSAKEYLDRKIKDPKYKVFNDKYNACVDFIISETILIFKLAENKDSEVFLYPSSITQSFQVTSKKEEFLNVNISWKEIKLHKKPDPEILKEKEQEKFKIKKADNIKRKSLLKKHFTMWLSHDKSDHEERANAQRKQHHESKEQNLEEDKAKTEFISAASSSENDSKSSSSPVMTPERKQVYFSNEDIMRATFGLLDKIRISSGISPELYRAYYVQAFQRAEDALIPASAEYRGSNHPAHKYKEFL